MIHARDIVYADDLGRWNVTEHRDLVFCVGMQWCRAEQPACNLYAVKLTIRGGAQRCSPNQALTRARASSGSSFVLASSFAHRACRAREIREQGQNCSRRRETGIVASPRRMERTRYRPRFRQAVALK